jgi:hypothetical protein
VVFGACFSVPVMLVSGVMAIPALILMSVQLTQHSVKMATV